MNLNKLYIGVMSGTSMDGVDTALVEIEDNRVRLLARDDYPMPAHIKQTLLSVCTGQDTNLKAIGELDHQLGHLFADAVLQLLDKSGYSAEQIRAIGNHGQTVFHQPTGDLPSPPNWVMPTSLQSKLALIPWQIFVAKTWR